MMQDQVKNYLSLTRKEWNGVVVLLVLIVLALIAPYAYEKFYPYQPLNTKGLDAAIEKLYARNRDSAKSDQATLFKFDPNHLPDSLWLKLGLNEGQISAIKNYEAKGGKFYSKADVKRIYTIDSLDYARLKPFINLPGENYKERTDAIVDINTANETQLMQLKGIGKGFAAAIIRYRDRLGGFHKKEQLKEIFGLDEFTYKDVAPNIRIDKRKVNKIDINKATTNNLMVFPYLTYKQKNAIVEYRNQHGDYKELADLENIPILDLEILRKIAPYIVFK
ncbi:helix-hairpin-helix domain-containing protein [Mucilaginibacter myungsuensis]|uniref:Helix-hairpin-helix domain-containing protein n=1 Tax=Mucilaginibacter myungsuensis TaxID=649104 RepID=A0A929L562_9SPHI|nr:helix-hairpin-helix domain-containing protein [Mucilaginibacter myungsuensis]MBE9664200.1 helix-hairpin-helix domain-containing protein [Mucilaginibacter myungsuensis]MDN3599902.1 helix-hairpin-helix domain-containing protein [Mucilaginibacter myungsuensis]